MVEADAVITLGTGNYRLQAPLGGSAYGVVWRAQGPRGPVALKLVNQTQMARAEPQQRARWIDSASKEIAFLGALAPWDERHIVRMLDSGWQQDLPVSLPVMALELMEGDLAQYVAAARDTGRTIELARIMAWLGQINQALATVHQHGWCYLDLKPANVLLTHDGERAKLADFGTNRPLHAAAASAYAGTANWQAPEQFFPGPDGRYHAGQRSDYFALGAMLYYLVSGGQPLRFCSGCGDAYRKHRQQGAAVLRALHGDTVPPTLHDEEAALFSARTGASAAALALLRALLQPDPAARPAHALQISRLIAAVRP